LCIGIVMGGLVNVWIHDLTGGAWGDAIRGPLIALSRAMPLLALLFVPVLLAKSALYPWAVPLTDGDHRWAGELSRPEFKRAWLDPMFFVVRSVLYLGIWVALAWFTPGAAWRRSRAWSAAALMIYGITATLAAVDWIMSLVPLWYSTAFGLLVVVGQGLAGLAVGIVAAALIGTYRPAVFRDLGNILLTYVLLWAYIAFTQYLIIWSENLPHEIAWYVPRVQTAWWWVGCLLIAGHFFVPLLLLLSRAMKDAPLMIAAISGGLLVAHAFDVFWLTVPSVRPDSIHVVWFAPLATAAFVMLLSMYVPQVFHRDGEAARG
jgi:hypothetical protein